MKLITISGLDGSGKTTQIDKLVESLSNNGKSVFRFHIIDFSIANKILGKRKGRNSTPAKAITSAGYFSILFRKLALVIDTLRFLQFFYTLKANGLYDYILTDRYFYDQIVNIHYLEKTTKESGVPLWHKITKKLIKTPDIALFVKVYPKTALSRDRKIEQGEQFLIDKQTIFDKFIGDWNIKVIDGEKTSDKVFEKIKEVL